MIARLDVIARRLVAATLLALWAVFTWPELRANAHERSTWIALGAFVATALAATALGPVGRAVRRGVLWLPERVFVGLVALASAGLTAWVHRVPMHGKVVSGDACMYVVQARALAHGSFSLPLEAPRLAYAAKFLFEGLDGRLHGVFVPGYPLFLAPFVRWDLFLAAALTTSVLLTLSHAALARTALRDPFAARLSLLLLVPSYARALETADLLSHAFTGAMAGFAVTAALTMRTRPTLALAAALGLTGGWLFSGRMLDGFVLAVVVAFALAGPLVKRVVTWRHVGVAVLCALPFAGLVAAQQQIATGSFRKATSIEYANRSDWPRGCLRLGFGREIGCLVEHPGERASFGPDGYSPGDALRLIRERAGLHASEVFGLAVLTLLGFAAVIADPRVELVAVALWPVLLNLAYGLFYYGNGIIHGARHAFPGAAFNAVLVASALSQLATRPRALADRPRVAEALEGAMLLAFAALAGVLHPPRWTLGALVTSHYQSVRLDLRALVREHHIDRGLVIVPDVHSYFAAIDPWRDGDRLIFLHDDRAGEVDARRAHPELPVWLVRPGGVVLPVRLPPPPPGLQLEFERAWPSFQRPTGLGASIIHTMECCRIETSGNRALMLFEVDPGDTLDVPFDLATTGNYTLRLDAVTAPNHGRFEILVDGERVLTHDGYAPDRRLVRGEPSAPRTLYAGPHVFTARSLGRDPRSTGYGAVFDALIATPAE